MDVREAIDKRRSIRKYQSKEVPDNLIMELIGAARLAPSGNNAQPSRFLVVKDAETRARLKEKGVFAQSFVHRAPVIIVCCADPGVYRRHECDDPNEVRAVRDLSIASSFLVLRATELGLGTCYVGWVEKQKIKDVLDIPRSYIVPYVIAVGYPAEAPGRTPRKSIKEIILE
jgi:nitroreductase